MIELDDLDAAVLAEAVDAVGRLVLARLVPPAVVVDDDRRRRQVDAEAARAKARGEDAAVGIVAEARRSRCRGLCVAPLIDA